MPSCRLDQKSLPDLGSIIQHHRGTGLSMLSRQLFMTIMLMRFLNSARVQFLLHTQIKPSYIQGYMSTVVSKQQRRSEPSHLTISTIDHGKPVMYQL